MESPENECFEQWLAWDEVPAFGVAILGWRGFCLINYVKQQEVVVVLDRDVVDLATECKLIKQRIRSYAIVSFLIN